MDFLDHEVGTNNIPDFPVHVDKYMRKVDLYGSIDFSRRINFGSLICRHSKGSFAPLDLNIQNSREHYGWVQAHLDTIRFLASGQHGI
jgi:hypothetical protein